MFIPGVNVMVLGALSGYISTGSLKGALIGAFTAGMAGPANGVQGFITNGIVGGLASKAMGGKFGHGFISAGFSSLAGGHINKIGNAAGKILAKAVVGGTLSKITGGKFGNGAMTAAFSQAIRSAKAGESLFGSSGGASGGQRVSVDTSQIESEADRKFVSDYLKTLTTDSHIDQGSLFSARLDTMFYRLGPSVTQADIDNTHMRKSLAAHQEIGNIVSGSVLGVKYLRYAGQLYSNLTPEQKLEVNSWLNRGMKELRNQFPELMADVEALSTGGLKLPKYPTGQLPHGHPYYTVPR